MYDVDEPISDYQKVVRGKWTTKQRMQINTAGIKLSYSLYRNVDYLSFFKIG